MKIITNELHKAISELAKENPKLVDLLILSNEETFDFSIYKHNRYKEMLELCKKELTEKLESFYLENKRGSEGEFEDYQSFAEKEIPKIIASHMPEQSGILLEIAMDNDFNMRIGVEYDFKNEDLSVYIRSWIEESMREDLNYMIDEIGEEIINKNEDFEKRQES